MDSGMPQLNQASWAFSQAAASALEQLQFQVQEGQAVADSLKQENEELRRTLSRRAEEEQKEQMKQALKYKEAVMDVERLQELVAELREALASGARRNEALANENGALSGELNDVKAKTEELRGDAAEQARRAEDGERRAGEAESRALELAAQLKEEQMRVAKAGHAARERAEALDRFKELHSEAAAGAKEASLRADAAQEAARVSEAAAEEARRACLEMEGRAKEAEASARKAADAEGQLRAELKAVEDLKQKADLQLVALQARMGERLRAQEERARQQAADAVEAAVEERDREAQAAEEARAAEAKTRLLLRELKAEVEGLRREAERQADDLAAAQGAADDARRRAEEAEATAQREAALRGDTEAMRARLEADLDELAGLNQELTLRLLKAEEAAPAHAPIEHAPALLQGQAPDVLRGAAVASSQPLPFRDLQAAARHGPLGSHRGWAASASQELPGNSDSLRKAGYGGLRARDDKWEQVRAVLEGLEDELREMDLRHEDLLRKAQDAAGGDPRSASRLAAAMRKDLAAMQRKGRQIASLRQQAEALRPPWGSPP